MTLRLGFVVALAALAFAWVGYVASGRNSGDTLRALGFVLFALALVGLEVAGLEYITR